MRTYEIALVEDQGQYYRVTTISQNTNDFVPIGHENYLNLSYSAYKIIDQALREEKEIRIKKPLKGNEVLPFEVDVLDQDINNFEYIKNNAFAQFKQKVTPEMTKESGIVLYEFIMANNDLSSKGYFITDKNREEKYIEIIETGDSDLIELLETFLETKDKLERAKFLKNQTEKFKAELKKTKTIEDVEEIKNKFIKDTFFNI